VSLRQGDIVWVPYPHSDHSGKTKIRPALVVSGDESNALDNDLLIVQITSVLRGDRFSVRLTPTDTDIPLPKVSEIRCNKIATVKKTAVISRMAVMRPDRIGQVLERVCSVFS
jgi:mRNA interferase MazF